MASASGNQLQQDKILVSRLKDMLCCDADFAFSDFLDVHQLEIVNAELNRIKLNRRMLWGGNDSCERKMLCIYDDEAPSLERFPISCLCLELPSVASFSHRDVLGSLLGIGLERRVLGDICVSPPYAYVYVKTGVVRAIISQLDKISRYPVRITEASEQFGMASPTFEETVTTVSSLRLDVLLSAALSISRNSSQEYIRKRLVSVDSAVSQSDSYNVSAGDIVSVRGWGRFKLADEIVTTKKGKLRVTLLRYR